MRKKTQTDTQPSTPSSSRNAPKLPAAKRPAPTHLLSLSPLLGQRILFLGAHADDLEIGCGGTAAKLAAAGRAIAFAQAADCGAGRREEAKAGAALLRLSVAKGTLFFGPIPDGRLEERKDVLRNWLNDVAERFQPDTVFVHRGDDSHPDHVALYEAAIRALTNHTLILYPIPKLAPQATPFQPNYHEDITAFMDLKLRMCACHASQTGKGIYLDPEHLRAVATVAHQSGFGRTGGYAEAFRIHAVRSDFEGTAQAGTPAAAAQRGTPLPKAGLARTASKGGTTGAAQPKKKRSSGGQTEATGGPIKVRVSKLTRGHAIGTQRADGNINNTIL